MGTRHSALAPANKEPHLPPAPSLAASDSLERQESDTQVHLLARAFQSVNDCVSITDSSDCILYVNDAFLRTYEYDEGEPLGQHQPRAGGERSRHGEMDRRWHEERWLARSGTDSP